MTAIGTSKRRFASRVILSKRPSAGTIDCADPVRMSQFWAPLLGIEPSREHGDDPDWTTLGSWPAPAPRPTFQRVPEPKSTKVRIHLDVEVDDIEAGRQRVENLGGGWSGVRHEYDEEVVLTMLNPEGHEFYLVQYFEKPTAGS